MHELSNCRRIIRLAEQQLALYPNACVKKIIVEIGAMRGVDIDELRELFPLVARETPLECAALVIETIPISYRCDRCNDNFTAAEPVDACKQCGSEHIALTGGTDFILRHIELDIVTA